jgi:hypothetical protein
MLPEQEEGENFLHLLTLKHQANAVSNRASICKHSCLCWFYCQSLVGLHIVVGMGFMQLERRGLHNINRYVGRMSCIHEDQVP